MFEREGEEGTKGRERRRKKRDVDCHNLISRGLQKATRAYFNARELYNKILATFGFLLGQVEWIADAGSTQFRLNHFHETLDVIKCYETLGREILRDIWTDLDENENEETALSIPIR